MNPTDRILGEIDADLRLAPAGRVVYLEGKTDVGAFFALLGAGHPRSDLHQGVLVRGLDAEGKLGRAPGSGCEEVCRRVELAAEHGRANVHGVLDGDGRTLDELAVKFGAPQGGPLFAWEGYCIENLLAQVAWPTAWGEAPVWPEVLRGYAAYVALNRLHAELRERLTTLRLHKFQNPQVDAPLLASAEVQQALEGDRHLIDGVDVAARFAAEVELYTREVEASLVRGHMLLNGKWLVHHFAATRTGLSRDVCRDLWCEAVRRQGGSPVVRDWWRRLIGS